MTFYDYLMMSLAILAVLIVLIYAMKTKHFFKTILSSAVIGLFTLIVLYLFSPITGFKLEVTPYTLGGSVVFGLPGVVCMSLAKMLFGL